MGAAALLVLGLAAGAAQSTAPDAERAARNVATFDALWATVRDTHWDPELGGVDWLAVRTELLPQAQAAATDDALRGVLMAALARLGQSHFTIIPAAFAAADPVEAEEAPEPATATDAPAAPAKDAPAPAKDAPAATTPAKPAAEKPAPHRRARTSDEGSIGATLTLLPREGAPASFDAIVTAVEPGSPAERASIVPGTVVLTIDGDAPTDGLPPGDGLERYERAARLRALAHGAPGETTRWVLQSEDGGRREVELAFADDPRPRSKFGSLPPLPTELTYRHLDQTERERWGAGAREIGLVRFNIWLIPVARPFDVAIDALRGSDGIILDLRGNPGGIGAMAMGLAGHFTAEPATLGEMRTRDTKLSFVTNPRRVDTAGRPVDTYAGPLAILVDETSASTTEIFAGGLQHLGRARIFGSRTAGAALPAVTTTLPNGDILLHAVADFRLPDNSALEASGVKPDGARPYARADYLREGDPAMAEAVRWIASQPRPAAKPAP
ncbi:MAG: S41 family peptidase [Phycisphaerales bacterium]